MNDKICMITGATDGIGLVTAEALAQQGATVIIVGRSQEKGEGVVAQLKQQSGNPNIVLMVADLSSQREIRRLVEAFNRQYDRLDVLVNNVGAFYMSRKESIDGIELTFALNHLGYFLLTNLLLDKLKASASARIVNVSSGAHLGSEMNLEDPQLTQGYGGWKAYSQSKLANILFTYELARRLNGTNVATNALHPGMVATKFATNNGWLSKIIRKLMDLRSISVEEGARTSIYLASSPDVEGITGKYFVREKEKRSSDVSYNEETAKRLWEMSEQMTGLAA